MRYEVPFALLKNAFSAAVSTLWFVKEAPQTKFITRYGASVRLLIVLDVSSLRR